MRDHVIASLKSLERKYPWHFALAIRSMDTIATITMPGVTLDSHVINVLMRDLVGHDRAPSAFILYLWLAARPGGRCAASLQTLASETGLSKSSIQNAIRHLERRKLIEARRNGPAAPLIYQTRRPWVRASG
ncbi:helix-turn-helix domain-containing protein [Glycocaulis sp.]|uniref:helix-turn-helix domain-containing protein n=1 Tax=Glycocaulis sp. TaxID=1969725 RepID=UPI0025B7BFE0|nr:helix-turn-helix domain-containing protein [Glycocaulis sp.]MCH8521134.1 helix-turn-helix domain-containing protein [Glycocaulis sp.]